MKNYLNVISININMILLIAALVIICVAIIYSWVGGIDYMHKNHPDYKGDDLFGEDTEKDI